MREQTQITPYFLFPSLAQIPGIGKPEEPKDGAEILVSVVLHCSSLLGTMGFMILQLYQELWFNETFEEVVVVECGC